MITEMLKSFLYLLLLNNFLFKYLIGVELPMKIENSLSETFKFSYYTFFTYILCTPIYYFTKKYILIPNNLEILSIILIGSITAGVVFLLKLYIKELEKTYKFTILNVIFLVNYIYIDNNSLIYGILYGILNSIFIFISFIILGDIYERIKTKNENMNSEFIYFLSVSIISLILFGFTGLKI